MELRDRELEQVDGGISFGTLAGIAAALVYFSGLFNGYINPVKCNK